MESCKHLKENCLLKFKYAMTEPRTLGLLVTSSFRKSPLHSQLILQ